ncbi:putative wall-associated receptor kinase-like 16 [Carex littledalei]|uniref:Putative wall-associated receptor kinase-like 16 n=1 Tax=Carex littledalei TaxID=544730 RepID=A0A833QM79_9POAL|nr:putative wall-associated receptor kinase-like 16 [Carex littledalei]
MACVRQLQLQCVLYLTLISLLSPEALVASTTPKVSLPGCPDKCGNITIPYPFGTRPDCCRDGFNITCKASTTTPKAFLGSSNIEIIEINITSGEARVYKHIAYRCYNGSSSIYRRFDKAAINIRFSPFLFSNRRNKFTAIGCRNLAYIEHPPIKSNQSDSNDKNQAYFSGCISYCMSPNDTTGDGGMCNGLGCCQTSIPAGLSYYNVGWVFHKNSAWTFNPCMYAGLVEEDWFKFHVQDLSGTNFLKKSDKGRVPFVLDWAIRDNGTCLDSDTEKRPHSACVSENSRCYNTTNGDGYICNCTGGYWGNPYLAGGCIDSILSVAISLGLCFLVATHQQHKRHNKEKEEYQTYYRMMDNHLRVFSKKEIENATNNFDEGQVLGAGGQGKVYKGKGFLETNQFVAIKKAKEVEETQRGEFVNEILLLSQINHKNIVRLLGCCLEDKIPMLVYEFVPNGTLFELLHGKGNTRPISLDTRIKVALDSAEALDYLHSSISRIILHGDVKSANILLEIDYRAKISDFGASNLVPNDDTQVVKVVQGTRGYLDPEYVATAVLTKKSDVYSFGVVLLELITRKCAIFRDETYERKHLASCFVSNARTNKLHELLDKDIVNNNEKVIEVLQEVSELAVWCLSVRGEDRPTMRQVVEKLQNLVRILSSQLGPERVQEETESLLGESTFYTASDTSAFHSTGYSSVLEIETGVPRTDYTCAMYCQDMYLIFKTNPVSHIPETTPKKLDKAMQKKPAETMSKGPDMSKTTIINVLLQNQTQNHAPGTLPSSALKKTEQKNKEIDENLKKPSRNLKKPALPLTTAGHRRPHHSTHPW